MCILIALSLFISYNNRRSSKLYNTIVSIKILKSYANTSNDKQMLCWHIYYDVLLHIIKCARRTITVHMPWSLVTKNKFHCSNIYILDSVVLLHVLLQEDRLGELLCALPTRIGLHPLLLLSVLLHMLVKLTLLKFKHTQYKNIVTIPRSLCSCL